MTTQSNINEAREAYKKDQLALDQCTVDRDAFEKFITQVNEGLWSGEIIPSMGPFTIRQAAMLGVVLPWDNDFPAVFFNNQDIWLLAEQVLVELTAKCETLTAQAEKTRTTLETMEKQYIDDQARAREIADNDPTVIAAKQNAEAAAITAKAEVEKKKIDADQHDKNVKMIVGAFIGFMFLIIIVALAMRIGK